MQQPDAGDSGGGQAVVRDQRVICMQHVSGTASIASVFHGFGLSGLWVQCMWVQTACLPQTWGTHLQLLWSHHLFRLRGACIGPIHPLFVRNRLAALRDCSFRDHPKSTIRTSFSQTAVGDTSAINCNLSHVSNTRALDLLTN